MGSNTTKLRNGGYHWSTTHKHLQQFTKYGIFHISLNEYLQKSLMIQKCECLQQSSMA